jgi:hypothetical protein
MFFVFFDFSIIQYGLAPIMKELGQKLQRELPLGSYILSNVFTFPGWKPLPNCQSSDHGNTYIYRTPDCWQHSESFVNNDKK